MSEKPEQARFSPTQIAIAGMVCAVTLIILIIVMALSNVTSG
jgi:hypothetical protein